MEYFSRIDTFMRARTLALGLLFCASPAWAAVGDVSGLIGKGRIHGDGGAATSAGLNHPWSVAVAPDGTVFIADRYNWKIRKVDLFGDISTFLTSTYTDKLMVAGGYLYLKDAFGNSRMPVGGGAKQGTAVALSHLVSTDGTDVFRVSGTKLQKYTDPVGGTTTDLTTLENYDWKLLAHDSGVLYVFCATETVRYVISDGSSSTLAGVPFGDWPYWRDGAFDGTYLYITESYHFPSAPADQADNVQHLRRYRLSDGFTDVLAGGTQGDRDGTGSAASFNFPRDLKLFNGKLYVADMWNHKIKTVDTATGETVSIAGESESFNSKDKADTLINNPLNVVSDKAGNIYIPNTGGQRVLKVSTAGIVTVLAGSGLAGDQDDTGAAAMFRYPCHLDIEGEFIYVADFGTHKVRRIHTETGEVTTLAGTGTAGAADGKPLQAQFKFPWGLAVFDGRIYVADTGNHTIREIDLVSRRVRTLAGQPGTSGFANGVGNAALFKSPRGLVADGKFLYIADSKNHVIRKLDLQTLEVTTVAGIPGTSGRNNDTDPDSVTFYNPWGLGGGPDELFVADTENNMIRRILKASGATSLLAGTYGLPWGDVDGPGASAQFGYPHGAFSEHWNGRLLVADTFNHKIRAVVIPTITDPEPPEPPTELTAEALAGLKIRLKWEKSESDDVEEYRIYAATAGGAFDFFNTFSTVPKDTTEFLAEDLTDEVLYRFIVRAHDSEGLEEGNTHEASAQAYDTLSCPMAVIKSPKNGKKVSGQRLTVVADFSDDVTDVDVASVRSVTFQYRALLEDDFADIPAANDNHPNPDTQRPFFVHWNSTSLANGEYYVRALSDCGSVSNSTAPYIMIQVEHVNHDSEEGSEGDEQILTEKVRNDKNNKVLVADPTANQLVQLDIPEGALGGVSSDTVKVKFKQKGTGSAVYSEPVVLSQVEIELVNSQLSNLSKPATITYSYDSALLARYGAKASNLSVGYLDPNTGRWTPLASSVNEARGTVTAQTDHFSIFGLLGSAQATRGINIGEVYFYPNPAVGVNPTLHAETNAQKVILRVYSKTGALVYEAEISGGPGLIDDGQGLEPAYEHLWDVSGVASDVYFYYVEVRNTGFSNVKKTGRVAVIK